MKNKIFDLKISEPLPQDFDPLLGKSVGEYLKALKGAEIAREKSQIIAAGSVFDDPDLDFSYEKTTQSQEIIETPIVEAPLEEPPAPPLGEIEVTPFETMDGEANEAIDQAIEEDNFSDQWRYENEEKSEAIESKPFISEAILPLIEEEEITQIAPIETQGIAEETEEELTPWARKALVQEAVPHEEHHIFEDENPIFTPEELEEIAHENEIEETPKPNIFDEPILARKTPPPIEGDGIFVKKDVKPVVEGVGIMAALGKASPAKADEIGILARSKQPEKPIEIDEIGPMASWGKTTAEPIDDGLFAHKPLPQEEIKAIETPIEEIPTLEKQVQETPIIEEEILEPQNITNIAPEIAPIEEIVEPETISEPIIEEIESAPQNNENIEALSEAPPENDAEIAKKTVTRKKRSKIRGKKPARLKKAKGIQAASYFGGVFFLGLSIMAYIVSALHPLGAPFDEFNSLALYWFIPTIAAIIMWAFAGYKRMVFTSAALLLIYMISFIPPMGNLPMGGNKNRVTVGWANIEGSAKSLSETLKQANENGASLLMLAGANGLKSAPQGWALIEAPLPSDPTALAVLSKQNWRAATLPGEPTMARPINNSITIIGVNPRDPNQGKARSDAREALINRTANRTGIEDIPVLVMGDFAAPPWDKNMRSFARIGQIKRILCGGYLGTTQSKGLFSYVFDNAYYRGLNIQKCTIGNRLPQGGHSPLWISFEGK